MRKDDNGTQTLARHSLVIAKGDTSAHAVARDRWTPNSSGTEQLVFVTPGYPTQTQSFSC